jgi:hypothetical protein
MCRSLKMRWGDQFVLREGVVWRLRSESGELTSLSMSMSDFDAAVRADPAGVLELGPLYDFQSQGGVLDPGQLLNVYPPFISKESAQGVTYRAVPVSDRLRFLSDLARAVAVVPDGGRVSFTR